MLAAARVRAMDAVGRPEPGAMPILPSRVKSVAGQPTAVFLRPMRADFGDTGCASSSLLTRDVKMRAAACRSRADQGWLLRQAGRLG